MTLLPSKIETFLITLCMFFKYLDFLMSLSHITLASGFKTKPVLPEIGFQDWIQYRLIISSKRNQLDSSLPSLVKWGKCGASNAIPPPTAWDLTEASGLMHSVIRQSSRFLTWPKAGEWWIWHHIRGTWTHLASGQMKEHLALELVWPAYIGRIYTISTGAQSWARDGVQVGACLRETVMGL